MKENKQKLHVYKDDVLVHVLGERKAFDSFYTKARPGMSWAFIQKAKLETLCASLSRDHDLIWKEK